MTQRGIYLQDIPLDEAWARLSAALQQVDRWGPLPGEWLPLDQALGRVTAEPVWARLSAPHYHASAMDGYAIRAADTASASDNQPVHMALGGTGPARYVDTGDPLPTWADAVIPIENIQLIGAPGSASPAAIELRASVAPWSHVRPMGEDIVATELVLPANHTLRPVDLGAMAAAGHARARVRRQPRVAVIPTGTELVPAGSPVKPGDIIEFNSLVLAAQVAQWGGRAERLEILPDDFERICAAVAGAAGTHDLVLLNAGSSAGSEDFSARVVDTLGTLLVHGVAARPGHPVILGLVRPASAPAEAPPSVPIIGVPGYPVSAALTGEIFVQPLLARWLGQAPLPAPEIEAVMTRKVLSPLGDDEYMRVTVGQVGARVVATPLARGAGVISSLVRADGLVVIPRHHEGLNAGDRVRVRLYRPAAEIAHTIVAIGSHDLCLDLMAQRLAEQGAGQAGGATRLASANVGSQGGLVALARGEAHLAGCHLLDPQTGEYNLSAIQRYLPGVPVMLIRLAGRDQGLMVARGNPRGLRTLADVARPGITYVNRQRGAGTRVLLDFEIGKIGLAPEEIHGYEREEFTHLAVAAAVASGMADCGLGIAAAAAALELDFLPLFKESYDLVIPQEHYRAPLLRPLLGLLSDPSFQREVAAMPGYDVRHMGQVIAEINNQ
jgi:putative molybdopterin biosynthesis protein